MIDSFEPGMSMSLKDLNIPRGTTYIRFKSGGNSWEVIRNKSNVILMFCPFGKMPYWYTLSDEELDNLIDALKQAKKDRKKLKDYINSLKQEK